MLVENGVEYWVADSHVHTNKKAKNGTRDDGKLSAREQLKRARDTNVDLVGFAGHDTDEAYLDLKPEDRKHVIRTLEQTTLQGHLLLYSPDGSPIPKIPMGRTLEYTVKAAQQAQLKLVVPHPDYSWNGIRLTSIKPNVLRDLYHRGLSVDGIETMSRWLSPALQAQADDLARELDLAKYASSDDHDGNIGRRFVTIFRKHTADPIADLVIATDSRTTKVRTSQIPPIEEVNSFKNTMYIGAKILARLPQKTVHAGSFVVGAASFVNQRWSSS